MEWRETLVPLFESGCRPSAEVGDGWKDVILGVIKEILELGIDLRLIQIKERFGDLYFQYTVPVETDPELQERIVRIVHMGERRARETCRTCSAPEADICSINFQPHVLCDKCKDAKKLELQGASKGPNDPVVRR